MPLSATVCGLPPPVSFTFKVAVREPVAAGLKVSVTVQLADGLSVDPQVLDVMLKSFAFTPDLVMLVTLLVRAQRSRQRIFAYGLSDHYRQIFELTRLDEVIAIHDTEHAAIAAAS